MNKRLIELLTTLKDISVVALEEALENDEEIVQGVACPLCGAAIFGLPWSRCPDCGFFTRDEASAVWEHYKHASA